MMIDYLRFSFAKDMFGFLYKSAFGE